MLPLFSLCPLNHASLSLSLESGVRDFTMSFGCRLLWPQVCGRRGPRGRLSPAVPTSAMRPLAGPEWRTGSGPVRDEKPETLPDQRSASACFLWLHASAPEAGTVPSMQISGGWRSTMGERRGGRLNAPSAYGRRLRGRFVSCQFIAFAPATQALAGLAPLLIACRASSPPPPPRGGSLTAILPLSIPFIPHTYTCA